MCDLVECVPASVALEGMEWILLPSAGWCMGVGRGLPNVKL